MGHQLGIKYSNAKTYVVGRRLKLQYPIRICVKSKGPHKFRPIYWFLGIAGALKVFYTYTSPDMDFLSSNKPAPTVENKTISSACP